MMWPLLQLDPVAQGLPCGSSAYPLDQRQLSHRVEGGWLILQQSLNIGEGSTMKSALTFTMVCIALAPAALHAGESSITDLKSIGIEQRLDEQVPLDLDFYDETSEVVSLGKYFTGKPVILVLAYYRCPMLCNEVLNTLRDCMGSRQFGLSLGEDFQVVTVSFDPAEKPDRAAAKKANYVESVQGLGQSAADEGWHFLTGSPASIQALTQAVGFPFTHHQDNATIRPPSRNQH